MKYFTLFPLQGYWGKWAGGIIAVIALLAGATVILTDTSILDRLVEPKLQLPAISMLLGIGLFLMALSKEKIDDERVQRIRYTALRGGVMLNFLAAFSFLFPLILTADEGPITLSMSDLTVVICLLLVGPSWLYLIIFHIGLRLDTQWAYNDLSAEQNVRKYPKLLGFLILLLLTFIVARLLR